MLMKKLNENVKILSSPWLQVKSRMFFLLENTFGALLPQIKFNMDQKVR
jgi:hypothetical protein